VNTLWRSIPVVLLGFAVSIAAAFAQNAVPAGDPVNGKTLWLKYNCYSCHGHDGHGGGAGPRVAPTPIAMSAFIAFVRQPPASTMPVFSAKIVPDADLRDIWAYLHAIRNPPALKDIPLLLNP
jgi:mono/diheme cytochrome c family protein